MNPIMALFAMAFAAVGPAAASDLPAPADLPPTEAVIRALDNHPEVRAAQARTRAARAEHDRLRAGSHEFDLRLTAQRRNVSGGPDHNEWGASVERGLRLPGKGRLDDLIGARGVEEAEERVGDARHEAGRQLLALWYAVQQARMESQLWRSQIDLLGQAQRIVRQRVKRGDAASMDGLQIDAALAQARSQAGLAEAAAQAAQAELRARFPELPAATDETAEPHLPAGGEKDWIDHTLAHNHELLALQRAVEKARLTARRAVAERVPDPTLGLHFANEQSGEERLFGVSVSIPIPGEGRRAQTDMLWAQADSLAELEASARRRLAAEAAANWQRATGGVESYRRLKEAAAAVARHADLAARAHELGELGLSEVLLARRQAQEARLAAERARLAANEAIARLLLDAHRLWPLGQRGDHH